MNIAEVMSVHEKNDLLGCFQMEDLLVFYCSFTYINSLPWIYFHIYFRTTFTSFGVSMC